MTYWILQVIAILMLRHLLNRRREYLDSELAEVFRTSLHKEDTHVWRLEYASWRRTAAWLVSTFGAVVVFAILIADNWSFFEDASSIDLLIFGALSCVAGLIPWYYTAEANGVAHVVTEKGIARRSSILKDVFMSWDQIRDISYSYFTSSFIIRGPNARLFISTTLKNIDQFARLSIRQVTAEKRQAAGKMLERAMNGPFR